ncbi:MAG: c-type cytochrome [Bdellovibrionaceae bacterium]|nr:c-type cytochrome [Pseudobdellovibrionaceae bacterium]
MENDKNDPFLMDHNYDGIQELDNPMPTWWLITFYATIIFAGIYFFHYELSGITSSDQELAEDFKEIKSLRQTAQANKPQMETQDLNALVLETSAIDAGKKEFLLRCAACHGQSGEGGIGPNLTDDFWIHGKGKIEDIVAIVNTGVTDKGMPAWSEMMSAAAINNTSAFVFSLKGTNPSNGKKPEGQKVE